MPSAAAAKSRPRDAEAAPPDEAVSVRARKAELPLYVTRLKVYPKAISGTWRRFKWIALVGLLGLYYVVPWLRWDRGPGAPDQAILIDLDGRRGWFFDVVIWPQEVYFVTGLLILASFGLFLATSLFGRVWCGFACPQTVWTDLFLWIERRIEGDRAERMRLDRAPLTATTALRKIAKHVAWLAVAAATGGAWVFYYVDAPTTLVRLFTGEASLEIYFFVGLFTATTYLLAGWAREQVCTYMCPWPRFQAAMLDEQSLIVTYQKWRGEPRGKHKAGDDWLGRGDCIDCKLCIAVCPTGIDIRDGQQIECIGCGLCIDACNQTMAKVDRPAGLIRWDTLANQQALERGEAGARWSALRPRTILYSAMLAIAAATMIAAFVLRSDGELTVQRDRNPNFVTLSNGDIRNSYAVKLLNKRRDVRHFSLTVEGLPGAALAVVAADAGSLAVMPDGVSTFRVLLTLPAGAAPSGSRSVEFVARAKDGSRLTHEAVFVGPRRPGERP